MGRYSGFFRCACCKHRSLNVEEEIRRENQSGQRGGLSPCCGCQVPGLGEAREQMCVSAGASRRSQLCPHLGFSSERYIWPLRSRTGRSEEATKCIVTDDAATGIVLLRVSHMPPAPITLRGPSPPSPLIADREGLRTRPCTLIRDSRGAWGLRGPRGSIVIR